MYWKYGSQIVKSPTIPFHKLGTNHDVTLTLVTETGEDLTDAYLAVADSDQAGLIQAKLSTDSTYRDVEALFNGNCWLGDISADTETDIDFRLAFPSTHSEGLTVLHVILGHDDNTVPPGWFFLTDWVPIWKTDWEDVVLWKTDWT